MFRFYVQFSLRSQVLFPFITLFPSLPVSWWSFCFALSYPTISSPKEQKVCCCCWIRKVLKMWKSLLHWFESSYCWVTFALKTCQLKKAAGHGKHVLEWGVQINTWSKPDITLMKDNGRMLIYILWIQNSGILLVNHTSFSRNILRKYFSYIFL